MRWVGVAPWQLRAVQTRDLGPSLSAGASAQQLSEEEAPRETRLSWKSIQKDPHGKPAVAHRRFPGTGWALGPRGVRREGGGSALICGFVNLDAYHWAQIPEKSFRIKKTWQMRLLWASVTGSVPVWTENVSAPSSWPRRGFTADPILI